MKAKMVLMGGMGYPLTETPWGMPQLKKRLEAIGITIWLGSWKDRQEAYDFAHGWEGWLGYAGDSLGAGSAAQYPGDVKRPVQYVAGFQPSMWDERAKGNPRGYFITVAPNISRCHAIYDPDWIDTGGLGYCEYKPSVGAKTICLNTAHRGAHPDDWGWSQDIVFNEIKGQLQ